MKKKDLINLIAHIGDDEEIYLADWNEQYLYPTGNIDLIKEPASKADKKLLKLSWVLTAGSHFDTEN